MKPTPQQLHAIQALQKTIQYRFHNPNLLLQALTHRSASSINNERLEFIGDAILDYSIAKMLFKHFPKASEGELSRLRANLVNQNTLAEIAIELGLGDALILGVGELKSGGFRRPSILSDALEAIFAAIQFDSHFDQAEQVIQQLFQQRIFNINPHDSGKDAKTRLQEALQAKKLALPKYRILNQQGEPPNQIFTVCCDLGELGHETQSSGSSRREAEQKAAKLALEWLQTNLN